MKKLVLRCSNVQRGSKPLAIKFEEEIDTIGTVKLRKSCVLILETLLIADSHVKIPLCLMVDDQFMLLPRKDRQTEG